MFSSLNSNIHPQHRALTYGLAVAVAAVLIGGGWFGYHHLHGDQTSLKLQKQQAQELDNQKKENVNNGKAAGNDSATSGNSSYVPPNSPDNITVTAAEANGQITVTTKLEGYSDGTCTLTTAKGAQTNTQTAQVIFQSQFSTCAGFSIPVSTLGIGTWNFNLAVTSGGITVNKTTSLEVK